MIREGRLVTVDSVETLRNGGYVHLPAAGEYGKQAEVCKYFTFFTLFDPKGLAAGNVGAAGFTAVLAIGAGILYGCAAVIFCKKNLYI